VLHTIEPERATLHGHFSRELPPVLTIAPGATVRFRTLAAGWNLEPRRSDRYEDHPPLFQPRDPELDSGHALCGPVAIQGAAPGMALAVRIDAIRVGSWGTTFIGGWQSPENDRLRVSREPGKLLLWTLDPDAPTGRDQHGHTLALRPFMGVMGIAPAEPGRHPTPPPRITGGNIDCKELVAGSTLYLPVAVPGALFSTGDGHALQGDGEVATTAIECPMERVDLTFDLRPDLRLTTPRAHTPAGWLTFGFHADLDEAMFIALEAMLDLLGELHGLDRHTALGLASLVVDLRITQIVNGVRGVHAVLPHGVLK
jgi:acetamidase/formamidase